MAGDVEVECDCCALIIAVVEGGRGIGVDDGRCASTRSGVGNATPCCGDFPRFGGAVRFWLRCAL